MYNPFYLLYRKGPFLNGFGFWAGKENHEICSLLTNVDSSLWIRNDFECEKLIQRHYESFIVCIYIGVFTLCVLKLCSCITTYIFLVRPIQKSIECAQARYKQDVIK